MARVAQLNTQFLRSLDIAGVTPDPRKRARTARVILTLESEPLPLPGDYEALLPWPGSSAWAHSVPELAAWVLYVFNDTRVELLWLATYEPITLE